MATREKPTVDEVRKALECPWSFRWDAATVRNGGGWLGITIGQKGRAATELRRRGITPEFAPEANCIAQIWSFAHDSVPTLIGWDLDEMLAMTDIEYSRYLSYDDDDAALKVEVTDDEIQNPGEGWDPEA